MHVEVSFPCCTGNCLCMLYAVIAVVPSASIVFQAVRGRARAVYMYLLCLYIGKCTDMRSLIGSCLRVGIDLYRAGVLFI